MDKYLNCFYEKQDTILEYLNEKFVIALDEINKIAQRIENVNLNSLFSYVKDVVILHFMDDYDKKKENAT